MYDPATDEWTKLNDMREGHGGGLAVVLNDGRVLKAGGHNQGQALASAEVFDPERVDTRSRYRPRANGSHSHATE